MVRAQHARKRAVIAGSPAPRPVINVQGAREIIGHADGCKGLLRTIHLDRHIGERVLMPISSRDGGVVAPCRCRCGKQQGGASERTFLRLCNQSETRRRTICIAAAHPSTMRCQLCPRHTRGLLRRWLYRDGHLPLELELQSCSGCSPTCHLAQIHPSTMRDLPLPPKGQPGRWLKEPGVLQ